MNPHLIMYGSFKHKECMNLTTTIPDVSDAPPEKALHQARPISGQILRMTLPRCVLFPSDLYLEFIIFVVMS